MPQPWGPPFAVCAAPQAQELILHSSFLCKINVGAMQRLGEGEGAGSHSQPTAEPSGGRLMEQGRDTLSPGMLFQHEAAHSSREGEEASTAQINAPQCSLGTLRGGKAHLRLLVAPDQAQLCKSKHQAWGFQREGRTAADKGITST